MDAIEMVRGGDHGGGVMTAVAWPNSPGIWLGWDSADPRITERFKVKAWKSLSSGGRRLEVCVAGDIMARAERPEDRPGWRFRLARGSKEGV